MDWTIQDFARANHNPVVDVNGQAGTSVLQIEAKIGEAVALDASQSKDPDNGQKLAFQWFHYQEAGSTGNSLAAVTMPTPATGPKILITPTAACRPQGLPGRATCQGPGTAHIILKVTDNGTPALTSYRRVILTVRP